MSLISLFDPPNPRLPDARMALNHISFANMDSHLRISAAVFQQFNSFDLQIPPLDPVNPNAFEEWLGIHQSVHNQMNVPLRINGQDFSVLDPNNQAEVTNWVFLHAAEHREAENQLRIG